jgi:serine-type D-Ala-D-Ala carboxypeptidase (penicillin-binding protein 5/6)
MSVVNRRFFAGAALLICLVSTAAPTCAQTFKTNAPHVFLMDAATHTVLFAQGADDLVVPAATAKIMTAELVFHALSQGKIHLGDMFKVSENAWRNGGAPARGSAMFAAVNSDVSVENLIQGLVIVSGNDAAIALAEGIAGSEANFTNMMTARARELGLNHLTFHSVWGQDEPDQSVTARDMGELADELITTYPDLYKYYAEKEFTWNKVHQFNRNPLLSMDIGADGLITGYIKGDGYDLIGSATQNGERLILALYGARTLKERADEARNIFDWGFQAFQTKTLFKPGETIGYASVYGGSSEYVRLVADGALKVLVPRNGGDPLTAHIVYTGPVPAPIIKGAEIARLEVRRGGSLILNAPLRAADTVEVGNLPRRAMDAGIELGIGMFRKYVLKD